MLLAVDELEFCPIDGNTPDRACFTQLQLRLRLNSTQKLHLRRGGKVVQTNGASSQFAQKNYIAQINIDIRHITKDAFSAVTR
jgi:hypothetical protein